MLMVYKIYLLLKFTFSKKSLKIPKWKSISANRIRMVTMFKRKRTNNDLQNIHNTKDHNNAW